MNYAPSFCKTTHLFLRRTLILSVILFSIVILSASGCKSKPKEVAAISSGFHLATAVDTLVSLNKNNPGLVRVGDYIVADGKIYYTNNKCDSLLPKGYKFLYNPNTGDYIIKAYDKYFGIEETSPFYETKHETIYQKNTQFAYRLKDTCKLKDSLFNFFKWFLPKQEAFANTLKKDSINNVFKTIK